jgi:thioredoxin reductase (NADPH)
VIDAGDSRAARIPRSHNVAGFPEGIAGKRLLQQMRRQVDMLRVPIVHGCVTDLRRTDAGFELDAEGGVHRARTVLLATGARDIEPPMAHSNAAIDRGALRYCPVCDGYEVAGCDVGVLCDGPRGVGEALYLRHFSDRVRLFLLAPISFDDADRAALSDAGIVVHEAPVSWIRLEGRHVAVTHGAQTTRCDSLYSALGMQVGSSLATALGAEQDADGYLLSDRHQETGVPGLYVAGDVGRGLNQISVAIGEAAIAASAMHLRLQEGTVLAVTR